MDDDVMARWRDYLTEVEALALKSMADPTGAALDGVVPVHDDGASVFGGFEMRTRDKPRNENAAWLRGAAKKLVPAAFRWQVQEAVGGGAYLILLAYEPPSDPLSL